MNFECYCVYFRRLLDLLVTLASLWICYLRVTTINLKLADHVSATYLVCTVSSVSVSVAYSRFVWLRIISIHSARCHAVLALYAPSISVLASPSGDFRSLRRMVHGAKTSSRYALILDRPESHDMVLFRP